MAQIVPDPNRYLYHGTLRRNLVDLSFENFLHKYFRMAIKGIAIAQNETTPTKIQYMLGLSFRLKTLRGAFGARQWFKTYLPAAKSAIKGSERQQPHTADAYDTEKDRSHLQGPFLFGPRFPGFGKFASTISAMSVMLQASWLIPAAIAGERPFRLLCCFT